MSSQIRAERGTYYDMLEQTQRGDLDVTEWLLWFLSCFSRAIDGSHAVYAQVLRKAKFWQFYGQTSFTERQTKVLNRYLDGFDGMLTARKWAAIGKCSHASALRDINDLLVRGVLRRNVGGSKNASYDVWVPQ
jgi:Fic family protein